MGRSRADVRALSPLEVAGARTLYAQAFQWAPDGFDAYLMPRERVLTFRAVRVTGNRAAGQVKPGAIALGRFTRGFPSKDFIEILDDAVAGLAAPQKAAA